MSIPLKIKRVKKLGIETESPLQNKKCKWSGKILKPKNELRNQHIYLNVNTLEKKEFEKLAKHLKLNKVDTLVYLVQKYSKLLEQTK